MEDKRAQILQKKQEKKDYLNKLKEEKRQILAQKKLITVTAVRPPARFGALKIKNGRVLYFKEKSKLDESWINGGFFVMEPEFLKFITSDKTYLEREPLENICKKNQLSAFMHPGFWQCMDTKRDKDFLEKVLRRKIKFE